MTYEPKHLRRWAVDCVSQFDSGSNYVGPNCSACFVAPCGRNAMNKDAPEVASNWKAQWTALKDTQATKVHFAHWTCGYDLVLIPETDDEGLRIADELAEQLEGCPLLDEDL